MLTLTQMPSTCCISLPTPENWGAYVDSSNVGITLYAPASYPDGKGFTTGETSQWTPTSPFSWGPGAIAEFDFYLIAGLSRRWRTRAPRSISFIIKIPAPLPSRRLGFTA
jgi:hypothetical protein